MNRIFGKLAADFRQAFNVDGRTGLFLDEDALAAAGIALTPNDMPRLWPNGIPPNLAPDATPFWVNGHPVELPEDEGESDDSGFQQDQPEDRL